MISANSLVKAARTFERRPGCNCAAKEKRYNAIVPGSGTAIKYAAKAISATLRKAARLIGGGAPELEGYTLVAACTRAAMYHNGRTYQVLSLANGQLAASGARGFRNEAAAAAEMGARCR